jgi:hypothetical protein
MRDKDRINAALVVVASLALACFGQSRVLGDEITDLIARLGKADRKERLAIIDKFGASKDARAGAALVGQLDRKIDEAEEREEFWLHLLAGLRDHGHAGNIDRRVLPRLDELSKTTPTVTSQERIERALVTIPKYDFQAQARSAADAVRLHLAKEDLRQELARMSEEKQLRHLIEKAWLSDKAEEGWLRFAARKELVKRGRPGIALSVRAVADMPSTNQGDLVAYFFDLYQTTRDDDCLRGLALLAATEEVAVWQDAVLKLGETRAQAAADLLVNLVKEHGDPPLRAALALEMLGQVGTKKHIPFLITQLARDHRDVRTGTASALRAFGKDAVPALKDALASEDRVVRTGAVRALIGLKGPERTEALKEFVRRNPDEDPKMLEWIRSALEREKQD